MTDQPPIQPLGVFAAVGFAENAERVQSILERVSGTIASEDRPAVAEYLRGGTCIDAWTESTTDLLGDKFVAPGGSAIHTDGTWFWRADTADYVEHYGTQLPEAFLDHVAIGPGHAPDLDEATQGRIFTFFREFYATNSTTDILDRAANQTNDQALKPLGLFAAVSFSTHRDLVVPALRELRDSIEPVERGRIAEFLRSATMVMPYMEHTRDLLEDSFGIDGGSAIMTDGTFFWRLDTAAYVETHGTRLPPEFLTHVDSLDATPPLISKPRAVELERQLEEFFDSTPDRELIEGT